MGNRDKFGPLKGEVKLGMELESMIFKAGERDRMNREKEEVAQGVKHWVGELLLALFLFTTF